MCLSARSDVKSTVLEVTMFRRMVVLQLVCIFSASNDTLTMFCKNISIFRSSFLICFLRFYGEYFCYNFFHNIQTCMWVEFTLEESRGPLRGIFKKCFKGGWFCSSGTISFLSGTVENLSWWYRTFWALHDIYCTRQVVVVILKYFSATKLLPSHSMWVPIN